MYVLFKIDINVDVTKDVATAWIVEAEYEAEVTEAEYKYTVYSNVYSPVSAETESVTEASSALEPETKKSGIGTAAAAVAGTTGGICCIAAGWWLIFKKKRKKN